MKRTSKNQILTGIEDDHKTLSSIVPMICYVPSGIFTYYAFTRYLIESKVDSSLVNFLALVSGFVVASLLVLVTSVYIRRVEGAGFLKAIGFFILISPFVVALSTWNNIVATSGEHALSYDLSDKAERYADFANFSSQNGNSVNIAVNRLKADEDSICGLAEDEASGHGITTKSGKGPIYRNIIRACNFFPSMKQTVEEFYSERVNEGSDEVKDIVIQLKGIRSDRSIGDIFARQDEFKQREEELAFLLSKNIQETGPQALANDIGSQYDSLISSYGENQSPQIEELKNRLEKSKSSLIDVILGSINVKGTSASITKPQDLMDMQEAILAYWYKLIPKIALGIAVDFFPLILCPLMNVFLIKSARARQSSSSTGSIRLIESGRNKKRTNVPVSEVSTITTVFLTTFYMSILIALLNFLMYRNDHLIQTVGLWLN